LQKRVFKKNEHPSLCCQIKGITCVSGCQIWTDDILSIFQKTVCCLNILLLCRTDRLYHSVLPFLWETCAALRRPCVALLWKEFKRASVLPLHDFFAARCHVWKELNLSLLYKRPKTCLGNELHGCKFNINALNALHVHVQKSIYIYIYIDCPWVSASSHKTCVFGS
jgi:hypothetical protein